MSNIDENRFNDENSKNKIRDIMKKYDNDNMLSQNDIKMTINAQNGNANEEVRNVRLNFQYYSYILLDILTKNTRMNNIFN